MHRPECSNTSGTFIELPAQNLKTRQGDRRKTIEKNGRQRQVWVAFFPITLQLAAINYEYHMAFIEERSFKLCVL